jgi:hypothetical protein
VILNPNYMGVIEWTDQMAKFTLIGNSTTQKLVDPDNWQDWAMNLVGDPDDIGQDAPNPYDFEDWRDWAELFFLTQELM